MSQYPTTTNQIPCTSPPLNRKNFPTNLPPLLLVLFLQTLFRLFLPFCLPFCLPLPLSDSVVVIIDLLALGLFFRRHHRIRLSCSLLHGRHGLCYARVAQA